LNGPAEILVVDDVPENVRLLEAVLVPRGYEVVTATEGRAALDLVETEEPDLILLDVMMPGLDGYAVCRSLRANNDTAMLPVIMVTSSIGQERTKAIEAGADDFIPKPFNHDELLTRIRSLLRIKRCHDTSMALEESVEQLRREADELCASRTRLVLAADADRRRIERELHDGAQQDLVGLAVKLQQVRGLVDCDPAAAGVLVDEMRGDVKEALDRLRSLAQRIHPPQLEAGGLPAALRSAAASAGVRVRIDVGANGVYPQEVSTAVYLCIVAAFERLVGTTAAIGIRERNGTVAFEIVAEEVGVDPADAHLAAIRDRVGALGGRLTITAVSGGGMRIAGSLPTRADANRSQRGRE
jgi:DNA-binding response OmpR family regulator